MDSVIITFEELFEYLCVCDKINVLDIAEESLYVMTPYSELVPILGYIKKDNHRIVEVTLEDDTIFKVSDKHLVFENFECKQIRFCKSVDTIDGPKAIKNFKVVTSDEFVYDISLDEPHIYITPNGVIHHNTTMICQLLSLINSVGYKTAYATGEESSEQLALTCERLGIDNIDLAHIKNVDKIVESMLSYNIIVVDSFQSLQKPRNMKIGEFRQYAQYLLINTAKETGCVVIFVLHVTTSGLPKGGTDIIHAVDVNIKMSVAQLNVVDTYKNRFGKTGSYNFKLGEKGFLLNESPHIPKKINYLELIRSLLSKSKNQKWKYVGECLTSVDQILKKIS